jgi:hypothetical protein
MKNNQVKKSILLTSTIYGVVATLLVGSIGSFSAFSQTQTKCPDPDFANYKPPKKDKYVNISELGIAIQVPNDIRVVQVKTKNDKERYLGSHFRVLTPLEYKQHRCVLANEADKLESILYQSPIYYAIENPQKLPINSPLIAKKIISVLDRSPGRSFPRSRTKINNINFFMSTVKGEKQINNMISAFIPRAKPGLIVIFETYEDIYDSGLGIDTDYQYFINTYLKKIRNISSYSNSK